MSTYLYTKDSKGKVRVLTVQTFKFTTHYEIHRRSGLLGGKMVSQPVLSILRGKVKRSVEEQAALEWRSIINKQRDKGYKLLQELGNDVRPDDYDVIDSLLTGGKTDSTGILKPMLAKDVRGWKESKYDKDWWLSRKLDGVRVSVRLINGKLVASSRGGKDYNQAMTRIFTSPILKWLLYKVAEDSVGIDNVEQIMLDGELYVHGRTLQEISGAARLDEYDPGRHDELEFWIFDYGHPTHTAERRCSTLNALHAALYITSSPAVGVRITKHEKVKGYKAIKLLHDKWVGEGFEGAIARDPTKTYKYGGRDDRMIKIKEFQDDEFKIIGIVDGLRIEDMCFRCVTEDGKEFSAKPMGTREVRHKYVADIENIIGKMLTVKFFNYTPDGIPNLPIGKCIRDYE